MNLILPYIYMDDSCLDFLEAEATWKVFVKCLSYLQIQIKSDFCG